MTNEQEFSYVDRNIQLYGTIDDEMAKGIVSHINQVNDIDEMMESQAVAELSSYVERGLISADSIQGVESREPIVIEINSGGGSVSAGFSIVNAIEKSQTPIIGFVSGDCMSMAIAVLASCHYRVSSRFGGFMIHDLHSMSMGKYHEMNSYVRYLENVRENYSSVLSEYTDLTVDEVSEIIDRNSDYFFSPAEAKSMGLIDALDTDEVDEELIIRKLYGVDIAEDQSELDTEDIEDEIDSDEDIEEALESSDLFVEIQDEAIEAREQPDNQEDKDADNLDAQGEKDSIGRDFQKLLNRAREKFLSTH